MDCLLKKLSIENEELK